MGFSRAAAGRFIYCPLARTVPGEEGKATAEGKGESHLIESLTNAVPLGHISGFDFDVFVVGCEKQLVKM